MFVDRYERFNIVKDRSNFLQKIEELELYIVEFNKDGIMKPKIYFLDCIV